MIEWVNAIKDIGFPVFAAIWLLYESSHIRKQLESYLSEAEQRAVKREEELRQRIQQLEDMRTADYKRMLESYHSVLQDACHTLKETEKTHEKLLLIMNSCMKKINDERSTK